MMRQVHFVFMILTLVASASAGALLYALWKRSGDRRARSAFMFYSAFLLTLVQDVVRTSILNYAIGLPPRTALSFADYPDAFGWLMPVLVVLSAMSPVILPPFALALGEDLLGRKYPKALSRSLQGACLLLLAASAILTAAYFAATRRGPIGAGLNAAVAVLQALSILFIAGSLAALGLHVYLRRRAVSETEVSMALARFLASILVFFPLFVLEQLFSAFFCQSPLARWYFSLFPDGLGFHWMLFLAFAVILHRLCLPALAGPGARVGPAGDEAGARAAAARLEERFQACQLSAREREIALLALEGAANKDIAAQLGISHATVKNHLNNAYRKLGISSRWELLGLTKP